MVDKLMWAGTGCKVASVTPLVKNAVSGKYELPATPVSYLYDMQGDGNTMKMPKVSDSKSEDTYLTYETASAQTIRTKIKPTTLTLNAGDTEFKEEAGSSTTAVYPELTIVTGNTPRKKSGETETRITLKENIILQLELQKTVSIVAVDMGKSIDGNHIGIGFAIGTLGDVSYSTKGKAWEGESLVFSGKSEQLAITATTAISILPAGYAAGNEVTIPALIAEDIAKLADGEMVIK